MLTIIVVIMLYCIHYYKSFSISGPKPFCTRDQFRGRKFFHGSRGGGDGSGGNASDGERWRAADEVSLALPPLTSCCAAQFLTGHGLILVPGPELGTPALNNLWNYETLSNIK